MIKKQIRLQTQREKQQQGVENIGIKIARTLTWRRVLKDLRYENQKGRELFSTQFQKSLEQSEKRTLHEKLVRDVERLSEKEQTKLWRFLRETIKKSEAFEETRIESLVSSKVKLLTEDNFSAWISQATLEEYKEIKNAILQSQGVSHITYDVLQKDISRLERNRLVNLLTKSTVEEKRALIKLLSEKDILKVEGLTLKPGKQETLLRTVILKSSQEIYEELKYLFSTRVTSLKDQYTQFEKKSLQVEKQRLSAFFETREGKEYQRQLFLNSRTDFFKNTTVREEKLILSTLSELLKVREEKQVSLKTYKQAERTLKKITGLRADSQPKSAAYAAALVLKKQVLPLRVEAFTQRTLKAQRVQGHETSVRLVKEMAVAEKVHRISQVTEERLQKRQIKSKRMSEYSLLTEKTVSRTYRTRIKEEKEVLKNSEQTLRLAEHSKRELVNHGFTLEKGIYRRLSQIENRKKRQENIEKSVFENRLFRVCRVQEAFVQEGQIKYDVEENRAAALKIALTQATQVDDIRAIRAQVTRIQKRDDTAKRRQQSLAWARGMRETDPEIKALQTQVSVMEGAENEWNPQGGVRVLREPKDSQAEPAKLQFARQEKLRKDAELAKQQEILKDLSHQVAEQGKKILDMSQKAEGAKQNGQANQSGQGQVSVQDHLSAGNLEKNLKGKVAESFAKKIKKDVMESIEKELRMERQRRGL